MPPRKSDTTKVGATTDEGGSTLNGTSKEPREKDGSNVEKLTLLSGLQPPQVDRDAPGEGRAAANTQIHSDAMLAMQKSATVFVSYVASHANEVAQAANRKTITPADIFRALAEVEFAEFQPRLEAELTQFNKIQTEKRNTYRKRVAAEKAVSGDGAADASAPIEAASENDETAKASQDARPSKRARMADGAAGAAAVGEEEEEGMDVEEQEGAGDEDEEEEEEEEEDGLEEEDDEGADALDVEEQEPPDDEDDAAELEQEAREDDDEALDNGDDSD